MKDMTEKQDSETLGPKGKCPNCGMEGTLEDIWYHEVFWCNDCGAYLTLEKEYGVPRLGKRKKKSSGVMS